jgi:hypothetical protein
MQGGGVGNEIGVPVAMPEQSRVKVDEPGPLSFVSVIAAMSADIAVAVSSNAAMANIVVRFTALFRSRCI